MTLQDIYNNLNVIIKKEAKGNRLSPSDFNRVLESANEAFFRRKLDVGLMHTMGGAKDGVLDTRFIENYMVLDAGNSVDGNGEFDLSTLVAADGSAVDSVDDIAAIVSVKALYDAALRKVDYVTPTEAENMIPDLLGRRLVSRPICYRIADTLYFLPQNVTSVDITFVEWPDVPFLDYYIDTDGAVQWFDEGDSDHVWTTSEIDSSGTTHTTGDANWEVLTLELDYEPLYHYEFMMDCLAQYGLSINEPNLITYSEQKKTEINSR